MSIHVTDFKWEKGKNDAQYIELLEKNLKNEQVITAKAVAKVRELSAQNKEIRAKAIDEFAERIKSFVDCGHLCSPTEIRWSDLSIVEMIDRIAEQLKGGAV